MRVVGLGHFELCCNGLCVETSLINQPWSQYNKIISWQDVDLKPLVREGELYPPPSCGIPSGALEKPIRVGSSITALPIRMWVWQSQNR